jgi:rare lipoprotein A (peptidoglycan hydrolase)
VGRSGRHRQCAAAHTKLHVSLAAIGLAVVTVTTTAIAIHTSSAQLNAVAMVPDPPRPAPRADRGRDRTPIVASPAPEASDTPAPPPTQAPAPAPRRKRHAKVLGRGTCQASYYGPGPHTAHTAGGEFFQADGLTAAHRSLPLGSRVRVTNRNNDRSVVVRINDRGPFVAGRCLDLSSAAMQAVGGLASGVIPVRYEVLATV